MRPVKSGLGWTTKNAGEIIDEVLHSAAFQVALALFLFLLTFILKVVSTTVSILVLLMWWICVFGISRSARFKKYDPSKRIALTVCISILLAVPFIWLATWGIATLKSHEPPPAATVTPAKESLLNQGAFSENPDIFSVTCGGNLFSLREGQALGIIAESSEGGLAIGHVPVDESALLSAQVEGGKLLVSAKLFAGSGNYVKVTRNVLSSVADGWDRNFDASALEAIDADRTPVLQVIYTKPYQATVYGVFQGRRMVAVVTPDSIGQNPGRRPWQIKGFPLKRIFKYPSRSYKGIEEQQPPQE